MKSYDRFPLNMQCYPINHLEGLFGHLKERIKIHRGLDENRKKKAVRFLLKNWGVK